MSFLSHLKHAFHKVGHALEHAAKDVAHGIGAVAKDVGHAADAALHAANDLAHLRLRAALNDTAQVATCLGKAAIDAQKAVVDAAADATADMHISKAFDKMAHGVKDIENKASASGVKLVDEASHTLANAAANAATSTLRITKDVATGHLHDAGKELTHVADNLAETASQLGHEAAEAGTAVVQTAMGLQKIAVNATADVVVSMHISKSVDHAAEHAAKFVGKAEDAVVKITDQVGKGVAGDLEGTLKGTIGVGKDLANGHAGKALSDGLQTAGQAVALAGDLTGEGLIANAAVATMQVAHVGGKVVQEVVGGVIGGPKDLMKRAAETGAGVAAGAALDKFGSVAATPAGSAALIGGAVAADVIVSRRGQRGDGAEHTSPAAGGRDRSLEQPQASEFHISGKSGSSDTTVPLTHEQEAERKKDGKADKAADAAGGAAGGVAGAVSTAGASVEAAATIAAASASAALTIMTQNALAQIQNETALNQALNSVIEELGKGAKALAQ
ncbi:hypothetical protein D0T25_24300 [Duganella sp. BJB488]|uniref:hypothetical protein n=1 Tax=unclassified Duganella TaxID=2636909 RepID=UPI000E357B76|nr:MULTISPECIES: hypothetical protein [unclassified Duganella]RFP09333.1 hypothetical protein D0T23_26885 [Duganella sp. BJB475]RFP13221.1 hypothetical protein D0T26_23320 [Duganella sp. BJB489]RFP17204.1 hypothetical protein D0T25_24300 [Duganella sp. BJB488]RFP25369.1 hypothetical protein D0T21_27915 [Duganella sp. BJB476]RFP31576.1 hypothetical protein D0T24_24415 [Duganella sp. BJB480]